MICKAYFVAAMLFIPHQVLLSGWLFTLVALLVSLVLNIYSCTLLSEVNDAVHGTFPQIAQKLYGTKMRLFTEFSIIVSQSGFVTTYIYFFASQFAGIGSVLQCASSPNPDPSDCSGGLTINNLILFVVSMIVVTPLTMITDIKKFAWTHIIMDLFVAVSLFTICYFAV